MHTNFRKPIIKDSRKRIRKRMGRVLSLLAEKGGVSKTTLATNIATALHREGDSVLLVDCDPQHTAWSWAGVKSGADRPETVTGQYKTLSTDVRDVKTEYDWLILDNAPGVSDNVARILEVSDGVLIPARPGVDLWAARTMTELVKAAQTERPELRAALVLTQVIHGTVLGRAVANKLAELDVPTLDTRIEMRVAYGEALITGVSVLDTADRKARQEIRAMTAEIRGLWRSN